ncbi:MAG TPA: glycosyltransferase family 2 protein [Longimicrobium sp.]|jgi:glycosyltransferase involved in cell wall biosynthesis
MTTLSELPPPPAGRTGWPWTEATPPAPPTAPDGSEWPRITLVTPSYNQGRYIEETIRSVLLQGYPNLEYVVFDGGSTDETVEILRRYDRWITHWASERDRGQTHAIAKGLDAATGDLFNWINSDDQLTPGALQEVGRVWALDRPHLVVGRCLTVDADDRGLVHEWLPRAPRRPTDFLKPDAVILAQPSTYLDTAMLREIGGVREELHYVMDWELYLRMTLRLRDRLRSAETMELLSTALAHPDAKTTAHPAEFGREARRVVRENRRNWRPGEWMRMASRLRRMEAHAAVGDALTGAAHPLPGIALLPFRYPDVVWSRFWWGGIRRALVRRSVH